MNFDTVMRFVSTLEPAEQLDALVARGLINLNGLKPSIEGGVGLKVLTVFIEGRGTNDRDLATGEGGLKNVRGIERATLGPPRTHEGMDLIDKEHDARLTRRLFDDLAQALLKGAAVLGARHKRTHRQLNNLETLELLGALSICEALGHTLDHGGLAHAWVAEEQGIGLEASHERLHDRAHLFLAPNDLWELSVGRELAEVPTLLIERGCGGLWCLWLGGFGGAGLRGWTTSSCGTRGGIPTTELGFAVSLSIEGKLGLRLDLKRLVPELHGLIEVLERVERSGLALNREGMGGPYGERAVEPLETGVEAAQHAHALGTAG